MPIGDDLGQSARRQPHQVALAEDARGASFGEHMHPAVPGSAGEKVQREADSKWWPIAPGRRPHVKGIVYVADGTVVRVRGIDPDGDWHEDDRGYADAPVTRPLTGTQITRRFPTLGLTVGDQRPHIRGKIREYVLL